MNFLYFVPYENLPPACQKKWKKRRFYSNIAADINGKCEHWEFNQGHIYRLKTAKEGKLEEIYSFRFYKGYKKFCLRFSSFEQGKEGDYK
jgi:hypothetical protein